MREIAHGTGTRADEMLGRPVSQYTALCRCVAKGYEAYHWMYMSRIHPECPDSDPPDRSVVADALRQGPGEEEDEEKDEGDGQEDDDADDEDDGYSE